MTEDFSFVAEHGTAVDPAYQFKEDYGTGFYSSQKGNASIAAGGFQLFNINTTEGIFNRYIRFKMNDGTYGWRDEKSQIDVKGNGANDPVWTQIGSSVFYAYMFPGTGTTVKQFWNNTHIQHDWAVGTGVHLHIHWIPSTNGAGNVNWKIDYVVAKGHNQQAYDFSNPTTINVTQAAPGVAYRHMIAEMSDVQAILTNVEPDTVIMARIYRDPADVLDTYGADVFATFVDAHYRVDSVSTKNKVPNFYV